MHLKLKTHGFKDTPALDELIQEQLEKLCRYSSLVSAEDTFHVSIEMFRENNYQVSLVCHLTRSGHQLAVKEQGESLNHAVHQAFKVCDLQISKLHDRLKEHPKN